MAGLLTYSPSANAFPTKVQWHFVCLDKDYIQQRDCMGFSPNSLFNQVHEPIATAKVRRIYETAKGFSIFLFSDTRLIFILFHV
jgi:hypothetical protein